MDPESVLVEAKSKISNSDSKLCVKLYVDRFFPLDTKNLGTGGKKRVGVAKFIAGLDMIALLLALFIA